MKKTVICTVLLIMIMLAFASCSGNTEPEIQPVDEPKSELYNTLDEELSSVLDDNTLSNADRVGEIDKLAEAQIARANDYKEKIKELYRKKKEKNPELFNDDIFKLDERLKTVDDYFDYLENEFENNVEFFRSYAFMQYDIGTGGSIFMARKQYECAKSYAEKAQLIYCDLVSATASSFEDFENPQLLESGDNYKLYQVSENPVLLSDDIDYWCRILDNDSEVVTEFGTSWQIPVITEKDGILCVTIGRGSSTIYSRFYNPERDILSEEYLNVLAWEKDKICYIDPETQRLIVCRPFDESSKEFDIDFYHAVIPVTNAEFISDNELKITYYTSDFTEKTETLKF